MTMQDNDWEPSEYDQAGYMQARPAEPKPDRWYRDNATVFHALEEWERKWADHAVQYEAEKGRPPSSMDRDKNKAVFRKRLCELYGRGEPDADWLDLRAAYLERQGKRGER